MITNFWVIPVLESSFQHWNSFLIQLPWTFNSSKFQHFCEKLKNFREKPWSKRAIHHSCFSRNTVWRRLGIIGGIFLENHRRMKEKQNRFILMERKLMIRYFHSMMNLLQHSGDRLWFCSRKHFRSCWTLWIKKNKIRKSKFTYSNWLDSPFCISFLQHKSWIQNNHRSWKHHQGSFRRGYNQLHQESLLLGF